MREDGFTPKNVPPWVRAGFNTSLGIWFFSLSLCLCESLKASVFISRSAAEKSTENEWGNTDSVLLFANRAESKAPCGCVQLQFCIHA